MRSTGLRLAFGVLLAILPSLARGQSPQSLPAVNLGFTSFLDGGPPAGPGLYFQEYGQYYTVGTIRDQCGDRVRGLGNVTAWVSLNQLIYQSDQEILPGAKWGIDVIVPLVGLDAQRLPTTSGVGDILVGPFVQWDPIMGDNGPLFMQRIEIQNLLPAGTYRSDRVLNAGSNFYSLNPYWAATVFILPQWTASWRLHYLWNAENPDPLAMLQANDAQAGQATHINFASEYEVLAKQLRVGINGYYLKQFTNAEIDGHGVADAREQVLGIGPGAVYHFSPNDHLFFNAYFETQAENRPEGARMIARWTHHF